jgi:hypothetical protein
MKSRADENSTKRSLWREQNVVELDPSIGRSSRGKVNGESAMRCGYSPWMRVGGRVGIVGWQWRRTAGSTDPEGSEASPV